MRDFNKSILAILLFMPFLISFEMNGQGSRYDDLDNPFGRIQVGSRKSSQSVYDRYNQEEYSKKESHKPKSSNPWIIYASAGMHSFRGDYSCVGKLSGTFSPQWSIGVGKWLAPWIGLKAEFMKSRTDGYTRFSQGHYGYGPDLYTDEGVYYRKMRSRWIDFNGSIMLNLSQLFMRDESYSMINQVTGGLGLGGVHYLGFENSVGSDNEIAAHIYLQYSRFLTSERTFSADISLGGIFYKSKQEIVETGASSVCCNLGVSVGFTWYIGQAPSDRRRSYAYDYSREEMHRSIFTNGAKGDRNGTTRSISFYVMYPEQMYGVDVSRLDENSLGEWLIGDQSDKALVMNSHSGLSYVYSTFGRKSGETIVSFADMYAALNDMNVDDFTNADVPTVELLNNLLSKGVATLIEVHRAGDVPNLDDYRTTTMVQWLKSYPIFSNSNTIVYVDNNFLPQSTRIPDIVNLNRLVKIKIQLVY